MDTGDQDRDMGVWGRDTGTRTGVWRDWDRGGNTGNKDWDVGGPGHRHRETGQGLKGWGRDMEDQDQDVGGQDCVRATETRTRTWRTGTGTHGTKAGAWGPGMWGH